MNSCDVLPATGSNAGLMIVIAAAAVILGAVLWRLARYRTGVAVVAVLAVGAVLAADADPAAAGTDCPPTTTIAAVVTTASPTTGAPAATTTPPTTAAPTTAAPTTAAPTTAAPTTAAPTTTTAPTTAAPTTTAPRPAPNQETVIAVGLGASSAGNVYELFDRGDPAATISAVLDAFALTPVTTGQTTTLFSGSGPCGQGAVNGDGSFSFQRSATGYCGFQISVTNSAGTGTLLLGFRDV